MKKSPVLDLLKKKDELKELELLLVPEVQKKLLEVLG